MDNLGSLDRLIPLLPTSFYYITFDLPGHGKSSHFPPYFPYYSTNNVIVYKLIADHFKRGKYIIMGHSYGGQIAYFFAQIYPECVEKLIMLETIHFFPIPAHSFQDSLRERYDFIINLDNKLKQRSPPTYTYTEAWKKLQKERMDGYITDDAAQALVKRAIRPAGEGKFTFTMDQRIKQFHNPIHDFRYIVETMKKSPVLCPVLFVLGKEAEMQRVFMKPLINVLKKMRNVKFIIVDGCHDVHNNNPENVAPHVSMFLLNKNAKL